MSAAQLEKKCQLDPPGPLRLKKNPATQTHIYHKKELLANPQFLERCWSNYAIERILIEL